LYSVCVLRPQSVHPPPRCGLRRLVGPCRRRAGKDTVRLSVGIEDIADLTDDLDEAPAAV
jgi:hypothetical protein